MINILITGGAGFIGSHLVDRLVENGSFRVIVLDNFHDFYDPAIKRSNISTHLEQNNFELVEGDIADSNLISDLFRRNRFDCVVHLAARAGVRPSLENPLGYENTNVRGTYTLLEAARINRVPKFIFGSSSSVYGTNSRVPFSEDDPISNPISPYAATKIAGEAACRVYSHLYDMKVICLRFFTVYGARQRPDLAIHKFARLISQGSPIPIFGDGSTRRDYTYIDDIISGLLAALKFEASNFEIVNLGESQTVELRELVKLLENAVGKRATIDYQPLQAGDVPITYADISKARSLLGYDPRTQIEEGIERFVKWFKPQSR
ncbi:MAG TPA: GDP-mannose 4,6-dehydratase [Blastocatellia bacterium]|nr:GDP-mannose 4,6-dehydratase [Blastocatellia bacterium]